MTTRSTVAIIHARGGSKRIPLKNLQIVGGKPLLAYPIALCRRCPRIDRIIVSTDHDGIAQAALGLGAEVPFRRPADLSEDVPSELVTLHALRHMEAQDGQMPEFAVTITPATPLTRLEQLEEGFALLDAHPTWDSVTTVRRTVEHPEWTLQRDAGTGELRTILGNPLNGRYNVSQNLAEYFYPTGAFWIHRVASLLEYPCLYGRRWGAVVLGPEDSIDIDYPDDLARADATLRARVGSQAITE